VARVVRGVVLETFGYYELRTLYEGREIRFDSVRFDGEDGALLIFVDQNENVARLAPEDISHIRKLDM